MPNHVTTIIKAPRKVLSRMTGEKDGNTIIDFNLIIPKPKRLDGVSVDGTEYIVNYLFGEGKHGGLLGNEVFFDRLMSSGGLSSYDDKKFDNFIKMLLNKKEYKHTSWYDWSCENWGTKWNAYDYCDLEDAIQFDTAWSTPIPVIKKLSEMFPDDEIEVKYADEDIGHNQGHFIIKNGTIVKELEIFDPILFAITLKGGKEEYPYYILNSETGKYEYDENYED